MTQRDSADFTIGTIFSHGWEAFKGNYLRLLGGGLLYYVIIFAASFIESAIQQVDPILGGFATLASALFISIPLGVGVIYFPMRIVRGNSEGITDLFAPYRKLFPIIGVSILVGLAVMVVVIPLIAVVMIAVLTAGTQQTGGFGVALIVLVAIPCFLAALFVGARLSYSAIILLDDQGPQTGVIDSIKTSWRITSGIGVWGRIIVVGLLIGLLMIVGALLLVLPAIFFSLPLGLAVAGATYVLIAANFGGWFTRADVCPQCGYSIQGLASTTCPECGTSLA